MSIPPKPMILGLLEGLLLILSKLGRTLILSPKLKTNVLRLWKAILITGVIMIEDIALYTKMSLIRVKSAIYTTRGATLPTDGLKNQGNAYTIATSWLEKISIRSL